MSSKNIGRIKIINADQQFSMLMTGQKLSEIGRQFTHILRANRDHSGSLMFELDDMDTFEYVKVMVENDGVEEHTYQVMCNGNDILLIDDQAFDKLMYSSPHVRKDIQILKIQS
jgi:hypothetical protein